MARDRYPLATLVEVREAEEAAARAAFLEAESALAAARASEAAALARLHAHRTRVPATVGSGSAASLVAGARWRERRSDEEAALRAAALTCARAVALAQAVVEAARSALAEASGHTQATARHEETWERAQKLAAARREERDS